METSASCPLVSIITPAYNSAPFLRETVDSALAQTLADFELLIVDDGSTDDTLQVARSLAERDVRIRVTSTPNQGAPKARNVAIGLARGQFLALLDSDDLWPRHYLATQVANLQKRPDVAIITANAFNRGGPFDGQPFWPVSTGFNRLALRDLIDHEDAVCIMSVMRREVIDRIGGFDARFVGNEDYHFWLKAAHAGLVILQDRTPMAWYRRRPDSVSSDERRMLVGLLSVLQEAEHMGGRMAGERDAIARQRIRFETQLARVEMRESLRRRDAAQAAQSLQTLSTLRPSWLLSTAARLAATWPTPLLWAFQARSGLRAGRSALKSLRASRSPC